MSAASGVDLGGRLTVTRLHKAVPFLRQLWEVLEKVLVQSIFTAVYAEEVH
jgi:hypothetical protein